MLKIAKVRAKVHCLPWHSVELTSVATQKLTLKLSTEIGKISNELNNIEYPDNTASNTFSNEANLFLLKMNRASRQNQRANTIQLKTNTTISITSWSFDLIFVQLRYWETIVM